MRALEELFQVAGLFKRRSEYAALIEFAAKCKSYAPYNAMLVRIQKPGAVFVATAEEWRDKYGRAVRGTAKPLLVLEPGAPVRFVFDVSDTEGDDAALPAEVLKPFAAVAAKDVEKKLQQLIKNCLRDGVQVLEASLGEQVAGKIVRVSSKDQLKTANYRPAEAQKDFEIFLNSDLDSPARLAALIHELARLYCGHLGAGSRSKWPGRQGLTTTEAQFESESVAYIVCTRLGLENKPDSYLSGFLKEAGDIPDVSVDRIMASASLIMSMCTKQLPPRRRRR
ncbi:MAG: hypothetical protein CSA62_10035 [Planctomycetota bacterium]|nr:MAG: hypothetical protein CSA62_10035 [Planctomycetota bacterium]